MAAQAAGRLRPGGPALKSRRLRPESLAALRLALWALAALSLAAAPQRVAAVVGTVPAGALLSYSFDGTLAPSTGSVTATDTITPTYVTGRFGQGLKVGPFSYSFFLPEVAGGLGGPQLAKSPSAAAASAPRLICRALALARV